MRQPRLQVMETVYFKLQSWTMYIHPTLRETEENIGAHATTKIKSKLRK